MEILNLTQHNATPEQIAAGVVEPDSKDSVQKWLTFDELAFKCEIQSRAAILADYAADRGFKAVMIGGAPFLMAALERELERVGVTGYYAFSQRVSVDETQADGSVVKRAVFKHAGFIQAGA